MRPRSHVTGDVGQKAVSLILTEWGWTADAIASDYGEDLDCQVFVDGQRTPLHFRCQVKSTLNPKIVKHLDSGDFSVRIATETCSDWLLAYYPVILVVYDRTRKIAYWADATAQIRGKLALLSKKTVTLKVGTQRVLDVDEHRLMETLTSFYAGLLKIHEGSVERRLFPVVMPRYRIPPLSEVGGLLRSKSLGEKEVQFFFRNTLPAWTTALRTLDSQHLPGQVFRLPSADLTRFNSLLIEALSKLRYPLASGEWLAFVCDPISFSISDSDDAGALTRELTEWGSFAIVDQKVVSDHDYAFEPPEGFIRQIGRRARSLDGYYSVSAEYDVAVQLVASTATTPADQLLSSTLRQHALGQCLAWECPAKDVDRLCARLAAIELSFVALDAGVYPAAEKDVVYGAITTPLFHPNIPLIPQARSWDELELGTVQARLERGGLARGLPGKLGSGGLEAILRTLVQQLTPEAPTSWLADVTQVQRGLPVDLVDRRASILRMRVRGDTHIDHITSQLRQALSEVSLGLAHPESLDVISFAFGAAEDYFALGISWSPGLAESSSDSVRGLLDSLTPFLDAVVPRHANVLTKDTTLNALRYGGELYFEGDRMY